MLLPNLLLYTVVVVVVVVVVVAVVVVGLCTFKIGFHGCVLQRPNTI